MNNYEFTALENEAINFNFKELNDHLQKAKTNLTDAKSAADVKSQICDVWKKVRKYVLALAVIPIIGKYVTILAELLDSLCP